MLLLQTSYGQTEGTYQPASECSNYNAFLTSSTFDSLKYYTDTIYPSGIMRFDLSKSGEYGGIEDLYPLLGVEQGVTFGLINMVNSRFNSDRYYQRYQQYYEGIKVDGGGYTISAMITGGGPGNPCDQAYMLSPHILSSININKVPSVASGDLDGILNGTVMPSGSQLTDADVESELVIAYNLLNYCGYYLAWKARYINDGAKTSWIDAHTGNVLKTIDSEMYLTAPMATAAYGMPNLDDQLNGVTTSLISLDGRVRTHNFNATCPADPVNPAQWTVGLIPTTTAGTWTNEAAPTVFQAHHVVSSVLPVFDGISINFGTVNVGSCTQFNATSLGGSTTANAFIFFGIIGGSTTALFDVAAHELGHTFLNDFLDYTNPGNQSLHEGIADMIGTYAESIIQTGGADWIMGDDEANVANTVDRDLQNPGNNFDCFTDVSALGSADRHARSKPLGHWFYIISQGKGNIIGLGANKSINIVLESLNLMGVDDDYGNMRAATLAFVDDEFGPCSLEGITVRQAWREICVGPADYSDCFSIAGNPWVCEEDDHLHLWIDGVTSGAIYRWTFPIEWTVQGNTSGNSYEGTHFVVTDFPKYDWYPRYFNIKVYSPTLGSDYNRFRIVKLIDCNGDDPTCEEFYGFQQGGGNTENMLIDVGSNTGTLNGQPLEFLKVFDTMGRMLYSGSVGEFDRNTILYSGIAIFSYFDRDGKFLKSEKNVLLR